MGNGIIKNLKFIWDCILQVIYSDDESCIVCGDEFYEDKFICSKCEKDIKPCNDIFKVEKNSKSFNCYSVAYYSSVMMELILRLKYKGDFRAGEAIAIYMTSLIKNKGIQFDIITYIPMTKKSLKKRGYNQSEYLASKIGEMVNKPVIHSLIKVKETKDQIGLSGNERWNNVDGSFRIINKNDVKNKKILLVDDVVTTGATAFCCSCELIKNESGKITILTAAKSKV